MESQETELNLWKRIIHTAKDKEEIRSSMEDEQIARVFIFSSDGAGMRNILIKYGSKDTKKILLALWDSFYEMLKVQFL